jgi:hypothetical protein
MKWMKERDLLIAQTMAFVQSVTGKKPDADLLSGARKSVPIDVSAALESALAETAPPIIVDQPPPEAVGLIVEAIAITPPETSYEPPAPVAMEQVAPAEAIIAPPEDVPQPILVIPPTPEPVDFQAEIRARVAHFRANQQRFLMERQAYSNATMDKVRSLLRDNQLSPPAG